MLQSGQGRWLCSLLTRRNQLQAREVGLTETRLTQSPCHASAGIGRALVILQSP
jgi:hypothetical protein